MAQASSTTSEAPASAGGWGPPRSSEPVDKFLIRLWAISINWPEPPDRVFVDEEYAKKTRFGGIIAPPYFNPFSHQVDEARLAGRGRGGAAAQQADAPAARGGPGGNAGGEAEYFGVFIRPGDVITSRSRPAETYERAGRAGRTRFSFSETIWHNQRGELVRIYKGGGFTLLGRE